MDTLVESCKNIHFCNGYGWPRYGMMPTIENIFSPGTLEKHPLYLEMATFLRWMTFPK